MVFTLCVYVFSAGPEIGEEVKEDPKAEEEPIDDSRQVMLLSESLRGLINSEMFRSCLAPRLDSDDTPWLALPAIHVPDS